MKLILFFVLTTLIFGEEFSKEKEKKEKHYYLEGKIGGEINSLRTFSNGRVEFDNVYNAFLEVFSNRNEILQFGFGFGFEGVAYNYQEEKDISYRLPLYIAVKNYPEFESKLKPYGKILGGMNIHINESLVGRSNFVAFGMGIEFGNFGTEVLYNFEMNKLNDIRNKVNSVKLSLNYRFY